MALLELIAPKLASLVHHNVKMGEYVMLQLELVHAHPNTPELPVKHKYQFLVHHLA